MKKNNLFVVCSILLSLVLGKAYAFSGLSDAKVTILAVDEGDTPIDGAEVGVGFYYVSGKGEEVAKKGLTDIRGHFTATSTSDRDVGGNVAKDGFYISLFHYDFEGEAWGRWKPWDPVIRVVLRKVQNPVPMFARDSMTSSKKVEIPASEQKIGFDLTKFDWVIPYGQGVNSDFIFYLERSFKDKNEWDVKLTLSFANEHDGIQLIKDDRKGGSLFRLPRFAPVGGYQKQLIKTKSRHQKERYVERHDDYEEDNNYIFRIRSEVDEKGVIKKAMYGKILGDIAIEPRDTQTLKIFFKYYLNPNYTRNLEFDPEQNLFGPLPPLEQVGIK